MLLISPRFNVSARLVAPFYLATIGKRVICIFFAAAMLLVWQVKAQEKTGQVAVFVQWLQSQDAGVRSYAASALGEIGKDAKDAAPALIAALKDQDAGVRRSAAAALGKIGKDAKDAAPALIAALKDQDEDFRS